MGWIENIFLGFISGAAEILPVSARAHTRLLLKLFGVEEENHLFFLLVHLAILGAVYMPCKNQIQRYLRAKAISHIPKRKRRRPLDVRALMDFRMLRTMLIPILVAFLFYSKVQIIGKSIIGLSICLLINGIILYLPQFFPGSNKDSRLLTRFEGLLMGLGGAVSIFPGLSGIGAALSAASVCGVDRTYALDMTMLMEIAILIGLIVYDILGIISGGIGTLSALLLLQYLLAAAAAFAGAKIGVRILRALCEDIGYAVFAYYSWGAALFAFIINLLA